ncbi:hypothetical protein RFI_14003 [Reticulomyxa filosa]|uniref:Transmembrane protein n=1 Tax=Reticulomyxa filosa TaxID=46433 RepID=X6NCX9_RETFI|nr:hypothetical protein RFI_14003 [Reticulomyxa filosa]|eukprot:ETO23182.1 hypothetical protein RFI_14003 [Reticulomyxa filosa]
MFFPSLAFFQKKTINILEKKDNNNNNNNNNNLQMGNKASTLIEWPQVDDTLKTQQNQLDPCDLSEHLEGLGLIVSTSNNEETNKEKGKEEKEVWKENSNVETVMNMAVKTSRYCSGDTKAKEEKKDFVNVDLWKNRKKKRKNGKYKEKVVGLISQKKKKKECMNVPRMGPMEPFFIILSFAMRTPTKTMVIAIALAWISRCLLYIQIWSSTNASTEEKEDQSQWSVLIAPAKKEDWQMALPESSIWSVSNCDNRQRKRMAVVTKTMHDLRLVTAVGGWNILFANFALMLLVCKLALIAMTIKTEV